MSGADKISREPSRSTPLHHSPTPLRGHSQLLEWTDTGLSRQATLYSQSGPISALYSVVSGDDTLTADKALKLFRAGTYIVWRGDFQNARQLLSAVARRITKTHRRPQEQPAELFRRHRQERAKMAELLGRLLVPLSASYDVPLRRAPDVALACVEAYGPAENDSLVSLRELQGVIGAHEWRAKGVFIAPLNATIHPHYGVFSPIRGEYLELVDKAPLPDKLQIAFDIGTGTGVLAAILGKRGVSSVIATDQDPRAIQCANDNVSRLGLTDVIVTQQIDLFPEGRAGLIVCNPPWIPATPASALDHAVYDEDSDMLRRFLLGVPAHLEPGGEVWLVLSDLAELLGLRSREQLLAMISDASLTVIDRIDTEPVHARSRDTTDPLHAARSREVTSLWRLIA